MVDVQRYQTTKRYYSKSYTSSNEENEIQRRMGMYKTNGTTGGSYKA